jgi:hypothetical protein
MRRLSLAANYLLATNQDTPALLNKLTDALLRGYQRELTYMRSDKGFSAFGESDAESSLWLSAFVLRSFAQSTAFITIDPQVLEGTAGYIAGLQEQNGSWKVHGRVIHTDMKGGAANSDLTRTAHVTPRSPQAPPPPTTHVRSSPALRFRCAGALLRSFRVRLG